MFQHKYALIYDFVNSIRFKLIAGLLIFLMPLLLLLVFNNIYVDKILRSRLADSNKIVLSLYLKQIDNTLEDVNGCLADFSDNDSDLSIIGSDSEETSYFLAQLRLMNKIRGNIALYEFVDCFFVYSGVRREFIAGSSSRSGIEVSDTVNSYIKEMIENSSRPEELINGWHAVKINNEYYLLRMLKIDNVYIGAWFTFNRLLIPLYEGYFGSSSITVFTNGQGEPLDNTEFVYNNQIKLDGDFSNYYITGGKRKYMVVGEQSTKGYFDITAITPDDMILSGFPYIQSIVIFIAAVTIVFLPLYLLLLGKTVLVPLGRLLSVMKGIRNGNLDIRINPHRTSTEFRTVNVTFNEMLTQIKKLKIDIYEENLRMQKVELERLQLQLKPHFFLNSLNIINTLARTKKYDLLQEMCMCLIGYFRYMFRSDMNYVSLNDELKHVKNYIRIQELRFPMKLSSEIVSPDYLENLLVPPLMIHTFVENAVKYSIGAETPVHLSIHIYPVDGDGESKVKIIISDTGIGFRKEVLDKLQNGERIIDEHGEHIGIRNIWKRLQMMYMNKAEISFRNAPAGGAVVEITIPLDQKNLDGRQSNAVINR